MSHASDKEASQVSVVEDSLGACDCRTRRWKSQHMLVAVRLGWQGLEGGVS